MPRIPCSVMQGPHVHVDGDSLGYGIPPNKIEVRSVDTTHSHIAGHRVSSRCFKEEKEDEKVEEKAP
jgi:hypothetical protein